MKKTGFYVRDSEHGWQTLGFAWYDKAGAYRQVEANTLEKDPLMAASFLAMFERGIRDRIEQRVDRR